MAPMRRAVLVLALIAPSGCDGEDSLEAVASAGLSTSSITLSALLRGNGEVVQAVASLRDPEGYPVTLTGGDELFLSAPGGPEARLVEYDGAHYTELETGALTLELVLARGGERVVSPISLPPGFALSGPAEPASLSQPIPIAWEAAAYDQPMRLDIGGPCLSAWVTRSFGQDPGGYTIYPADLAVDAGVESCDLIVEATRSVMNVTLASALGASSLASVEQVRVLSIATSP